ncbi:MFS transporter [Aneurinibacillus migulanus]|uniref:D-galactonate transporter n=1 Tax=Aneurinibacillus migulanus TaxID=47500 RepID=A0A0D1XQB2_ANEMI|nr:MFS transporter [Aneurinibacillus migulanus]KIV56511.1 membrane protein [Aneurinibacillus migulanus]KON95268.1 membrane protein [Aneurinibacillus migulanus]MED0893794.1 MFS transporter [Aneurinibacillus migulanus]MED1617702.1 MFS transporter [Aneurinibacillus migulanus]SDI64177.1 D-galactonate transporter [Aneurinibacillus migulanus]
MNNATENLEKRTIRKVTRRIVPFLFVLYIISYLDRANIGYAALEMNEALGLTSQVFGIATGIFFIGYFLFEVPSNILMQRFGARVWITRILITWGIISVATGFAQNATQLYIIRFLLGVAEAGFFPAVILYITYWFRIKEQASTIAMFMTAIAASYIIGAPFSTWIMDNINWMGIPGWRWMFVLEGMPAVILGIVTFFYLTDRPEDAKWLTKEEKNWLLAELKKEREAKEQTEKNQKQHGHKEALTDSKVWYLALIYFVYIAGTLGVGYWMPQIIKGLSTYLTNTQIGLIATIPYIAASIAMNYWSRRSDRMEERRMHSALPLIVAAITLIGAGMTAQPFLAMFLITVSLAGMYCFKGPFWALPTMLLTPAKAAVGIAVINSIGNLGGFVGPYAVGLLKDTTGSTSAGLYFLSAMLLIAFLMLLFMRKEKNNSSEETNKIAI